MTTSKKCWQKCFISRSKSCSYLMCLGRCSWSLTSPTFWITKSQRSSTTSNSNCLQAFHTSNWILWTRFWIWLIFYRILSRPLWLMKPCSSFNSGFQSQTHLPRQTKTFSTSSSNLIRIIRHTWRASVWFGMQLKSCKLWFLLSSQWLVSSPSQWSWTWDPWHHPWVRLCSNLSSRSKTRSRAKILVSR